MKEKVYQQNVKDAFLNTYRAIFIGIGFFIPLEIAILGQLHSATISIISMVIILGSIIISKFYERILTIEFYKDFEVWISSWYLIGFIISFWTGNLLWIILGIKTFEIWMYFVFRAESVIYEKDIAMLGKKDGLQWYIILGSMVSYFVYTYFPIDGQMIMVGLLFITHLAMMYYKLRFKFLLESK